MVFHGDYESSDLRSRKLKHSTTFRVGDLVFIKDDFLHGNPVGIVTEVRDLCYDRTGDMYTALSVHIGGEIYTLSENDFELVKSL